MVFSSLHVGRTAPVKAFQIHGLKTGFGKVLLALVYHLASKRSQNTNCRITAQCGMQLNESKMKVAQCVTSGTICEQKVLLVLANNVSKMSST